ncbi:MAG: MFS transporter [Spirochaetaceae bacterium]|nr:MAG: MFS transporter [Spirochaetaceae bacterium]
MILPILPLHIRALGAGLSQTGIIMAMFALGSLAGSIPGGMIIGRIGKKRVMLAAVALEALLALTAALVGRPWLMAPVLLGLGMVHTVFFLARLAYFRELVPGNRRGRALSLLGGETRMGSSLGPVIGGFVADWLGFRATFVLFAAFSSAVLALVAAFVPDDGRQLRDRSAQWRENSLRRTLELLRDHRHTFVTAGFAVLALKLVREARKVLFPLWGDSIGMSASGIGVLFGVAYLVELALFYPAGSIMDRWGRKKTAIPCMLVLSLGFLLLPLARTPVLFVLLAAGAAIGNGIGAGINMTLGTDLAPQGRIVEFLALWRTVTDAGGAASPAIVGFAAAGLGLAAAAPVIAAVGFSGAVVMALAVEETLRRG